MNNPHFVIAIGRQFGSGGREIGRQLAEKLNIPYYDKELITQVAQQGGFSREYVEQNDEKITGQSLSIFGLEGAFGGFAGATPPPLGESLFRLQSAIIRQASEASSCIIVGRCADHILRDHPLCISLFVSAQDKHRTKRILASNATDNLKDAIELMRKIDKQRAEYYNFYTNRVWGQASSYDLAVDSSSLDIASLVKLIEHYIVLRIDQMQNAL